jgi:hypothetical protein
VTRGGEEGLVADVESMLRVTINNPAVLDRDALATALEPIGTLAVTFPAAVVDGTTTLFPAGSAQLGPADVAKVLSARTDGERESAHIANVRAIWSALAAQIGSGKGSGADVDPVDFPSFLQRLLSGPIQVYDSLVTTPVPAQANPDGLDVGTLDVPNVVQLMASIAPSAMIAANDGLNFRIENALTDEEIAAAGLSGVTNAQVTRDLIHRLMLLGGNVLSVSGELFTPQDKATPDTTQVFAVDDASVQAYQPALGEFERVQPSVKYPVVNVVVVVGRTYLAQYSQAPATTVPDTDDAASDDAAPGTS